MLRETSEEEALLRTTVPMQGTGADQLVVAVMRLKDRGAKGLSHSADLASQPGWGGAGEIGKALQYS